MAWPSLFGIRALLLAHRQFWLLAGPSAAS
jgi:hypothetical protein